MSASQGLVKSVLVLQYATAVRRPVPLLEPLLQLLPGGTAAAAAAVHVAAESMVGAAASAAAVNVHAGEAIAAAGRHTAKVSGAESAATDVIQGACVAGSMAGADGIPPIWPAKGGRRGLVREGVGRGGGGDCTGDKLCLIDHGTV
jgi:hypothetical protein